MAAMKELGEANAFPRLLASSEEAGWEGVEVRVFHEPSQLEEWNDPGSMDTSLALVARGSLHLEQRPVNGSWKQYVLAPGHLLLKPRENIPTEVRWRSLSCEPLHLLFLTLSQQVVSQTAQELTDKDPSRLALVHCFGFQDPLLTQIGLALWRELDQDATAGKLYAQAAARMLAVHLVQHYSSLQMVNQQSSRGLSPLQLKHLVDFLLAHLNEDLSLEVLAAHVGLSASHFAHQFREATGESPHQFVLRQRIERAKHLLQETDLPLVAIAADCGFANQSHLTQAFRRSLNLTPRVYRQIGHTSRTFLTK